MNEEKRRNYLKWFIMLLMRICVYVSCIYTWDLRHWLWTGYEYVWCVCVCARVYVVNVEWFWYINIKWTLWLNWRRCRHDSLQMLSYVISVFRRSRTVCICYGTWCILCPRLAQPTYKHNVVVVFSSLSLSQQMELKWNQKRKRFITYCSVSLQMDGFHHARLVISYYVCVSIPLKYTCFDN